MLLTLSVATLASSVALIASGMIQLAGMGNLRAMVIAGWSIDPGVVIQASGAATRERTFVQAGWYGRDWADIHRAAYRHHRGSEVLASDIEGVAMKTVFAIGGDKQARSVAAVVAGLVAKEKVPRHDIAALICDGAGCSTYEMALAALPIPETAKFGRIGDYGNCSLTNNTARRFKGPERLAVILLGSKKAAWSVQSERPGA